MSDNDQKKVSHEKLEQEGACMKPDQVLVVEDNGAHHPVRLPWFHGKFDTLSLSLLFPQV